MDTIAFELAVYRRYMPFADPYDRMIFCRMGSMFLDFLGEICGFHLFVFWYGMCGLHYLRVGFFWKTFV